MNKSYRTTRTTYHLPLTTIPATLNFTPLEDYPPVKTFIFARLV